MSDPFKLFICYRSDDAAKVDKIARDLSLLKYPDGTQRYIPWQDKHNLPPASPDWWDAIIEAIDDNHIFVFHISEASLKSEVCKAELDYAYRRNYPIIPVILDEEFFLNSQTGQYDITYRSLLPEWMVRQQFLFYTGAGFYVDFQRAVEMFQRNWPLKLRAQRPLGPDGKNTKNHDLYNLACEYAEHLAFTDAEKIFTSFVRRNDPDFRLVSAEWLELLRLYSDLIDLDGKPKSRFLFKKRWKEYKALFPKEFIDGMFDPKRFVNYEIERDTGFLRPTRTFSSFIASLLTTQSLLTAWGRGASNIALLEWRANSHSGMIYIDRTVFTIGRKLMTGCHAEIPLAVVSSQHFRISYDTSRGIFMIEDLASKNFTYLNDKKLLPLKAQPLSHGDEIFIAPRNSQQVKIIFRILTSQQ